MQIVIDIDEETYNDIKKGKIYSSFRDVPLESVNAIANGTLLPKGHGELIDRGALPMVVQSLYDIRLAPTIIEADTAESEGEG